MKNASEHYDEYYRDVEKSGPFNEEMEGDKSPRRGLALKYFRKFGVRKIIDVGCGPGFDAVFFMKNGFRVYACDVSKKAIEYAKSKNPGPEYFQWDAEKKPINIKAEGIYAFEIIEHVFDYDDFLRNLHESLNDGGILVLSTPNVLAPRNRIKVMLGKDDWFACKYHVHYFSPHMMRVSLEKNGFEVLEVTSKGKISFLRANYGGSMTAVARKAPKSG
jgi:2-polyprenyl-3-methyl-5-hydroxy-6-metoxy-1,4-benzoquinol methylase